MISPVKDNLYQSLNLHTEWTEQLKSIDKWPVVLVLSNRKIMFPYTNYSPRPYFLTISIFFTGTSLTFIISRIVTCILPFPFMRLLTNTVCVTLGQRRSTTPVLSHVLRYFFSFHSFPCGFSLYLSLVLSYSPHLSLIDLRINTQTGATMCIVLWYSFSANHQEMTAPPRITLLHAGLTVWALWGV